MKFRNIGIILVVAGVALTAVALVIALFRQPPAGGRGGFWSSGQGVAVINLTGPIAFDQGASLLGGVSGSADQTMRDLERAEQDRRLRAVVIRINSPGGSAAASQELYAQVQRLKKSGKKVVASFGDVAASGGYYVGVAADRILADPATVTGSIGVIAEVPNLQELYRKLGITQQIFKSGTHKDMLSPTRPVTPEEAKIMQGIIDNTYQQFLEAVAAGRHLPLERVRELADGRIYTGSQAKELGLVDGLGSRNDAIRLAGKLAGIKGEPQVIEYREPLGIFDFLRAMAARPGLSVDALRELARPPLYTTLRY